MFLVNQYKQDAVYLKRIRKYIIIAAVIAVLTIIASGLITYFLIGTSDVSDVYEIIGDSVDGGAGGEFALSWYGLFLHNSLVIYLMPLTGFLPFLFIPAIELFFNAAVVGVVCSALGRLGGFNPFTVFASGILPHGIFELSAMVLAAAVGIDFTMTVIRIIRKKTYSDELSYVAASFVRLYLTVILPLLIAAGLIESLLTPQIMARALGL